MSRKIALLIVALSLAPACVRASEPAHACQDPRAVAERYRAAIEKGDPEAIVRLLPKSGLGCMDQPVASSRIAHDIRTPGTLIHSVLFDGERLRRDADETGWQGEESMREFFARAPQEFAVERVPNAPPASTADRVCIRWQSPHTDRLDTFLCVRCEGGEWVMLEWPYLCEVGNGPFNAR